MVVFELTMPRVGSWNGKWTGADRRYIRTRPNYTVPKDRVNRDYDYDFGDGWRARVSVTFMPCREAKKLERKSSGFQGYDWMIKSIIKHGYITTDSKEGENE